MKGMKGEKGYILLLVPVVLVGISALAYRSVNRSQTSIRIAGAQFNYLQTQLCAEQCAAVAVNAADRTLESNGRVTSHGETCACADPEPGKSMACATSYADPVEQQQTNCYGLVMSKTDVDIAVSCHEGQSQAITLDEDVSFQEFPVFQFAVFFDGVLEMYPGADMDITGRIHANDTVRIFPSEGNLRMYDWVTSATVITGKNSKDGQPAFEGFPLMDGSGPDALMGFSNGTQQPLHELIPGWDAWQKLHRVAYGDRAGGCGRVDRLQLPVKGMSDPHQIIEWRDAYGDGQDMRRQKFAWRAGLIYKGGWKDNDLNAVAMTPDPARITSPKVIRDAAGRVNFFASTDGITVKLIPIDVAQLQQRGDSIVYLFDSYPDAAQGGVDVGGFFLFNGKTLKRPITIVSNTRMYNWGDFNTDAGYTLPSGKKNAYPAALVADIFTQLSNEWDGTTFAKAVDRGGASIKSKKADASTTLNGCVMAGMIQRDGSWTGQGGYQNLIHFMEDWSGVPFHYSGSTVCLWSSQSARGAYTTAWYYPPVRPWSFDAMYKQMENMPPGTPRLVAPKLNTWELTRN